MNETRISYSDSGMGDNQLVIDMVYVAPAERRQGKARKLIAEAIQYARDNGFESVGIWAEPQEDNISKEDLILFYESCGFSRGADYDEDMIYVC